MSCIVSLLRNLCPEIERQLKPNLRGMRGLLVRGYLPQVWIFETEAEIATLSVDGQGNALVRQGRSNSPDVTIRWKHDFLTSVLRTGSRASIPGGVHPIFMFDTQKGRAAFNYLRGRLGL